MLEFVNRINANYEVVQEIMNVEEFDGTFHFQVKWEGLPDQKDWTWKDAQTLHTDIPDMVENYLRNTKAKPKFRRQVCASLNLS